MAVFSIRTPQDIALRVRRRFFGPLTGVLNPLIRRFAGASHTPLVGLIHHQGRRSGRSYATPVGLGLTGAAFLIPLTFGADADWCRNVLATGQCSVKWRGSPYDAVEPEIVNAVSVRAELALGFQPLLRLAFRAMGIHQFLRLRLPEARPISRGRPPRVSPRVPAELRRAALYVIGHGLNPLTIGLARRRRQGRLAIVEHRGRRSGRIYATPVEARRASDGGFIIPLTWGEGTDWFRNVRTAGACVLQWHGQRFTLTNAEIVAGPHARSHFHPFEQLLLSLGGVRFELGARGDDGCGR